MKCSVSAIVIVIITATFILICIPSFSLSWQACLACFLCVPRLPTDCDSLCEREGTGLTLGFLGHIVAHWQGLGRGDDPANFLWFPGS